LLIDTDNSHATDTAQHGNLVPKLDA
jgi:hypothetical protein